MTRPIEPGCLALVLQPPSNLFNDDDVAFKILIGKVVTVMSVYGRRRGFKCWLLDSDVARHMSKKYFGGADIICPEEYLLRLDDPDASIDDDAADARPSDIDICERALQRIGEL